MALLSFKDIKTTVSSSKHKPYCTVYSKSPINTSSQHCDTPTGTFCD